MTNEKMVFEHLWRYFELHANQRIALFRYYLVFFSLYVTGTGFLLSKNNLNRNTEMDFIMAVSFVFVLITIIFILLDARNRELIHIAEASLQHYENKNFEDQHKIFNREKCINDNCSCFHVLNKAKKGCVRHTFCIRFIYSISALSAMALFLYALFHH